ncbi:MAG TPA: phosphate/phosphite/phosphonate ABC transporter substrate-binding protein [Burkholderiales bacterium]|nr:phosphate/phosphite/phosphonate ABC transporter substrate-binding protein [Burkholderiales bacterium]
MTSLIRRLSAILVLVLLLPTAYAQAVLNVGLVPAEDPRLVVSDNKALIEHLSKSLQMEVKPFVATDYNGVIEALRAKKLDIALLGPFSYVLATTVVDIEPFAIPETEKQGATYKSIVIARKDRGWKSLADLAGKTFAFVDPSSTSGHLFPKAALIRGGYNPDVHFSRVIFSGGHDASAIAVQNGKVDAAAIADVLLEMAIKREMVKKEDIAILWTSQPIPAAPFVLRKELPTQLKARIRKAFAEIRDMPWGPSNTIKRWESTNDSAYDVVRDTAKLLNLDLKKLK